MVAINFSESSFSPGFFFRGIFRKKSVKISSLSLPVSDVYFVWSRDVDELLGSECGTAEALFYIVGYIIGVDLLDPI
jgi:hypothetical protein